LYEKAPDHPGMAVLAAPFTDTDRVEYLDKA
jgi:ATP-dependent DNA helicase RecG